jgi:hypothetical protein
VVFELVIDKLKRKEVREEEESGPKKLGSAGLDASKFV